MKKKISIGFVLKNSFNKSIIIIPYHFVSPIYKKLQIKLKKYSVCNYRFEYKVGDVVFFDSKKAKVYNIV